METVTRRERNARFGHPSPELEIPEAGEYLWEWYYDISSKVRRVHDGVCCPIPPSDFQAWIALKREIVYPWEYDILSAMDVAFCDETNKELSDKREREKPPKHAKGSKR